MDFEQFQQISLKELNWYFQFIEKYVGNYWHLQLRPGSVLFPNIALFTETKDHFILELFGISKNKNALKVKLHRETSTVTYLSQSKLTEGETGRFILQGSINGGISGCFIRRELDYKILKERFPFCDKLWNHTAQFILEGGDGFYFDFQDEFQNCYMNNCILGNRFGNIHRLKHISFISIVNQKKTLKEYHKWFNEILINALLERAKALIRFNFQESLESVNPLVGTRFCANELEESYILAGQFSNIFLFPGLRETTIGEFIHKNPAIIKQAFSCKSFLYEPELKWIEGNPDPTETSINPDLMVELSDGSFDIYDLKTAAIDKQSITKGGHRRRRFIDYVQEGIAQLVNYKEYFKFEKNQHFAQKKYKIKFPNLL